MTDSHRSPVDHRRSPCVPPVVGLTVGLFVLSRNMTHAYVDPSAGGMLIQFFLGGFVAGFLMLLRLLRGQVASLFRLGRQRDRTSEDDTPQP
jgi:hypothetical protein